MRAPHTPRTRDVVGNLKGFRNDKIPLSEIISRVGGQGAFDAAVLETILLRAMNDVSGVPALCGVPARVGRMRLAWCERMCMCVCMCMHALVAHACARASQRTHARTLQRAQVMPVHGSNALPETARITSDVPQLMAAFDPGQPLTFEVRPTRTQAEARACESAFVLVCVLVCLCVCVCVCGGSSATAPRC
jgi:hypothetical protein